MLTDLRPKDEATFYTKFTIFYQYIAEMIRDRVIIVSVEHEQSLIYHISN